ncbi:molybdopterin-dependent oxidoreductase [Blastococcus sp. TML/M2B]|uniref:molybdopterin-dependent oxidoreductase n=1 Tax=unclassified Blastococcus TaxID=2619396 RepID=UPI00190D2DA1|nr:MULTISPECIES: molybdopterin-dependent oxidoreductase [unclassified Blastococcus]MBN1094207.1 molybdopterin-dependent oxidoreductase [Blastococcus sp. TML/M2B]MBN1095678.1 molybdopterin-dependent oxidoreductase [Blastococcus sp. TML/C7B]
MTTTLPIPDPLASPDRPRGRAPLAALAGLLAALVALGAGELVAGLVGPASSPVVAVGDAVIALTPEPVTAFAIETFGRADKVALVVGTLLLVGAYALLVGVLGLRDRRLGVLGVLVLGAVGALAAVTRPAGEAVDALPSLAAAVAGVLVLLALLAPLGRSRAVVDGDPDGGALDRRRFVVTGAVAVGAAAVAGGGGRLLQRRTEVTSLRAGVELPVPASPAPPLPAGADLAAEVEGLTPLVTRNGAFYRIDTALVAPRIRPADYRLEMTGMFDAPRSYTLDDLLGRPDVIERDITLTCVSNEVGGALAGSARWLGVPLAALLRENGIRPASDQLLCRSQDGMTIGTPTRSALEVEDAMLAFGMNGEPLPVVHGFPVRMVIPGLYGYVSACKWLTRIEATTFDAVDAFWVKRDWAVEGPITIASRIDTPEMLREFPAGPRAVAGVAWAQTRGIARVEVRVDDGDWVEARLSPALDADVWRQWVLVHDFAPGRHVVTVRATSTDGEVQTDERAAPFPAGASGWHSVEVLAG